MDRTEQIDTFCRYTQVSRETIRSLVKYEELLIKANKKTNLIGNTTIKKIWNRHFLDSAQVIDFIDKNEKTLVYLGSGAGFPGLVISIIALGRKIPKILEEVQIAEKREKISRFLYVIFSRDLKQKNNAIVVSDKKTKSLLLKKL